MFNQYNKISDSANRIVLSQKNYSDYVILPFFKFLLYIIKNLKKNNYIKSIYIINFIKFKFLILKLIYFKKIPAISVFKIISKTNNSIFLNYKSINNYMNNRGLILLSTSKGVLSVENCRSLGIGGKVICYVF